MLAKSWSNICCIDHHATFPIPGWAFAPGWVMLRRIDKLNLCGGGRYSEIEATL